MEFQEWLEYDEAWGQDIGRGLRNGFVGAALGAASLVPSYAQAQTPAASAQTPIVQQADTSWAYSDQQLHHIVRILSEQFQQQLTANEQKIIELAKTNPDYNVNPKKAINLAAVNLLIGPIFNLKAPFRLHKLVSAAETYVYEGKEDNLPHLLRGEKIKNHSAFGGKYRGQIRGSIRVDNQLIDICVDDDHQSWVSAALIHKLGPTALTQKSILNR